MAQLVAQNCLGLKIGSTIEPKQVESLDRLAQTQPTGQLYWYELAIPELTEQRAIANAVDEVVAYSQKLETIYTQKLANLDELKQSLLQKAFAGQLTAREETAA